MPVPKAKVQIHESGGKLLETVYTEEDGLCMWYCRYTSEGTSFLAKVPEYGTSQPVN